MAPDLQATRHDCYHDADSNGPCVGQCAPTLESLPLPGASVDFCADCGAGVPMAFVATTADGSTIHYQDGKRYLWLASLSGPLIPMLAIALYFWTDGNLLTTFFPLAYTFIFTPLADAILGEDRHNPPEEVVPMMSKDNYYRALLYVAVVLTFT